VLLNFCYVEKFLLKYLTFNLFKLIPNHVVVPGFLIRQFYLDHFFMQEVVQECQNMNWGTFKTLLTDALIDHLHPIQVSYSKLLFVKNALIVFSKLLFLVVSISNHQVGISMLDEYLISFEKFNIKRMIFTFGFDYIIISFVWMVLH